MLTEDDIRQEHPLLTGHRLLEKARRASAHPKLISHLEHRNRLLANQVVESWKATESDFPILATLHQKPNLLSSDVNDV